QPAHGRRACLPLMSLRAFIANELTDLKFAQPINDEGADDERGKKSSKASERRTKSQVPEDAERGKVMEQLQVQQPIEQLASPFVVSPRSASSHKAGSGLG